MMGDRTKEKGAQHRTHIAYFKNLRESNVSIAVIENVTEYSERLVKKELGVGWDQTSVKLDPRCFGIPCSRARIFILCWRTDRVRWVSPFNLKTFVGLLVGRVVMKARDYFFMDIPKVKLTPSAVTWLLNVCNLRYCVWFTWFILFPNLTSEDINFFRHPT